jgi:hypothetical protein
MKLSVNDDQHDDTQQNSKECYYAECPVFYCYAECRYTECRGALQSVEI